ncbi:putative transposable element [Trichonephila clavipes]|nr:putative transposable element [Trichonephila clavipes]
MITNFFIPELSNHDVQELWFQPDGATCHTARAIIDLLKDRFGDRLISRFGPVNWPPRSCDLTPLDYFLWGNVKSLVYADKPQTLDSLEDNIRLVIADVRPQMLGKAIENWTSRLDYIQASRGSPMPEIIFKIKDSYMKDCYMIAISRNCGYEESTTIGEILYRSESYYQSCRDRNEYMKAVTAIAYSNNARIKDIFIDYEDESAESRADSREFKATA